MATPQSPSQKPFHIAVIGGGIGGLCTTIGLLHQGIPCTLYEAAPAFAEIGAGVSFGPNAVRAMSLIDDAIRNGYEKRATKNAWPSKQTTWFDFRIGMKDWRDVKAPAPEGETIQGVVAGDVGQSSVHRAHFLDELVALVPEGVAQFGKRLVDVEDIDGSKVRIIFQDGTKAEADAVLGCDGVKSRTRQLVVGPGYEPDFSGKYAYRGLIPMERAVNALGDEFARNSQVYLGHHGHILTFPIEKGKTMNVVAFKTKEDGKWEDERWVLPMKKEDMFKDFEDWGDSSQHILSLMEKPDKWALFDHPPAPVYFKGRLCLLGDAAHASTPHQGAGAGQAIEDAYILTNLLGGVELTADLERVFKAYDEIRRPRSQRVVTTSREAAQLYEFEDENVGFDLEKMRDLLGKRYDWIWNEDLESQLAKARQLMRQ